MTRYVFLTDCVFFQAAVAKQVEIEANAAEEVGRAFCQRYNINFKLLKEIISLKEQLGTI